jgi:hypothetical protein
VHAAGGREFIAQRSVKITLVFKEKTAIFRMRTLNSERAARSDYQGGSGQHALGRTCGTTSC